MSNAANTWQAKVIKHLKACGLSGDRELFCMLVTMAMLDKNRNKYPRFGVNAIIWHDGQVITGRWDKNGNYLMADKICMVDELVMNFQHLAEDCKLSHDEAMELFTTLQKWIKRDFRAKSNLEEANKP